jgi:GTP cyclohydrolase I
MKRLSGSDLVTAVKKDVKEIDVHQLKRRLQDKSIVLVDIRELDEWVQGKIDSSHHLPRGFLELQIENIVMDRDAPIALTCAGGVRSVLGARSLQEMGYNNVVSVAGGFGARRPQMQERMTTEIAEALVEHLDPLGVAVVVEAEHSCLRLRGARKEGAEMVTSAFRGVLRDDRALREEVLRSMRGDAPAG